MSTGEQVLLFWHFSSNPWFLSPRNTLWILWVMSQLKGKLQRISSHWNKAMAFCSFSIISHLIIMFGHIISLLSLSDRYIYWFSSQIEGFSLSIAWIGCVFGLWLNQSWLRYFGPRKSIYWQQLRSSIFTIFSYGHTSTFLIQLIPNISTCTR